MKTLHILCDDAGLPPKLEAPIARLRARADVAVSVRTEKFSSDVGVPFPVAFLHDTGKGERLAHEFGVEAVEHMVAEMISSESIFEALVDAEVDAEIHLASSARLALKITRDLSCVQALIEALRADSTLGERAVEKFKRWANVSFDTRWAHPHEAALLALAVGIQEAYTEGVPALVATAIQTPNASWVRAWAGVVSAQGRDDASVRAEA